MSKIRHVMVDIECLGLKPGCKILQIGATTFNWALSERFLCSIYRNLGQSDLVEEQDTVDWWNEQSEEAKNAVLYPPSALTLEQSLERFSNYLTKLRHEGDYTLNIWSKPASFDLPILKAAYEYCKMELPWNFREEMCFRTLYNLFPEVEKPTFIGVTHTALADAVHQAAHAERIFEDISYGYEI